MCYFVSSRFLKWIIPHIREPFFLNIFAVNLPENLEENDKVVPLPNKSILKGDGQTTYTQATRSR